MAETWHNPEGKYHRLEKNLMEILEAKTDLSGNWVAIAIRMAVLAGILGYSEIPDTTPVDISVVTGDCTVPISAWYLRKMGFPIGNIICCCNENGAFWDLLSRGQMKLNTKVRQTFTPKCDTAVPAGLELLIKEKLDWDDVEEFLALQEQGSTYYLSAEEHRHFQEGFSAAVVGDKRVRMAIPNLYNTNGYILCPYSALVYTGLMDYRSHPGPRRAALMLTEYDPRDCADTVIHALAISDQELKEWCQSGAVR